MKKIKIIVVFIMVFVIGFLLMTNVFFPCEIGEIELYVSETYTDEEVEFYSDIFDALIDRDNGKENSKFVNDEQLVRTNPELPSNKEMDYKTIALDVDVNNRSFFDLTDFSASINVNDPNSRILYTYGNVVVESAKALKGSTVCVMWMKVYCGDLTDEELLEYIRGLDLTIYYESPIAGVKEQKVSLNKVENK